MAVTARHRIQLLHCVVESLNASVLIADGLGAPELKRLASKALDEAHQLCHRAALDMDGPPVQSFSLQ